MPASPNGAPARSLEHRRLAVVAALREAAAEPVAGRLQPVTGARCPGHVHRDEHPAPAPAPVATVEAPGRDTSFQDKVGERLRTVEDQVGEMQQQLGQVMHRLRDLEAVRDELESLSGEDDDREGRVSVPPLTSAGQMSSVAAAALFGA